MQAQVSRARANPKEPASYDVFQSPPYLAEPLVAAIRSTVNTVWEPAAGRGYLAAGVARATGRPVVSTDAAEGYDFLDTRRSPERAPGLDAKELFLPTGQSALTLSAVGLAIVTNPPFSLKLEFIRVAQSLGVKFAFLVQTKSLGSHQFARLVSQVHVLLVTPRPNFQTPFKGWAGKGAQFDVAWILHGFEATHPPGHISHHRLSAQALEMRRWLATQEPTAPLDVSATAPAWSVWPGD